MGKHILIENIDREELFKELDTILDKKMGILKDLNKTQTNTEYTKVFSLKEAADYLGMHPSTLKNKCNEGKIEFSKDGNYYFTFEYLDNYIKKYKNAD